MNISIRDYVIKNFKDDTDSIEEAILNAVKEKEEEALPGMGVLFELLWTSSNDEEKSNILDKLKKSLEK